MEIRRPPARSPGCPPELEERTEAAFRGPTLQRNATTGLKRGREGRPPSPWAMRPSSSYLRDRAGRRGKPMKSSGADEARQAGLSENGLRVF